MTTTVLALGHNHKEIRAINLCTQETWDKTLAPFNDKTRWEASNLAAHGWDVLLFDDVLFIGGSDSATYFLQDGTKKTATIEQRDIFYPRVDNLSPGATKHWDDSKKLGVDIWREREIDLSSLPDTKTFRIMYRALEMYYYELTHYNRQWKKLSGEELDYQMKFDRIKAALQRFWNSLQEIA